MLSPGQRAQFEIFGYIVLRNHLTAAEMDRLDAEALQRLETGFAHAPFTGVRRYWIGMNGPTTPFMTSLVEDPRFCGVAEALMGEHTVGGRCDASRSSQDTTWHPDTASPDLQGVQFAIYLQPVGGDSGALRVIPGSHRRPLHEDVDRYLNSAQPKLEDVPAVPLCTNPGDVICYDIRVWHAVAGGFADRRFCNLTYYNLPPLPEAEKVARMQDLLNRRFVREMVRPELDASPKNGEARPFHPHEALFDPAWVANPEHSARRARWIQRLRALGFLDEVALPPEPIELPHA